MSAEINYEDEKCHRFNESLDEEGDVTIANNSFSRSRILYEMDFETYKQAFYEFLEQDYDELKQTVFDYYPACIAYNYRLSERGEGSVDPVRKLLYLKDSWESIIFVLYALVMGEVRNKGVDLKAAQVFVSYDAGANPIFSSFNTNKILSDALKQKLQNMKAIVQYIKNNALEFKCEEIELNLFDDLLQLQEIRNDISHHNTPTREQAQEELKSVLPLFREMLVKTRFLEYCKILKFESLATDCRCETFNGHSLNREFENFALTELQKDFVVKLGRDQLFVLWGSKCFSLSPFLYFDRDTTGHESYICVYKRKKQGKFWYEPVKTREEKTFDHIQTRFDMEKEEIIKLVVP